MHCARSAGVHLYGCRSDSRPTMHTLVRLRTLCLSPLLTSPLHSALAPAKAPAGLAQTPKVPTCLRSSSWSHCIGCTIVYRQLQISSGRRRGTSLSEVTTAGAPPLHRSDLIDRLRWTLVLDQHILGPCPASPRHSPPTLQHTSARASPPFTHTITFGVVSCKALVCTVLACALLGAGAAGGSALFLYRTSSTRAFTPPMPCLLRDHRPSLLSDELSKEPRSSKAVRPATRSQCFAFLLDLTFSSL